MTKAMSLSIKKTVSYWHRNPHYKPKTVWRSSQIYNRNFFINKTVSSLWIEVQIWRYIWRSWWRHQMENFPRNCHFVRGILRLPVNFPHKGQWRGTLVFSLICGWTNGCANGRDSGNLEPHLAHYDVALMCFVYLMSLFPTSFLV